MKGSVTLTYKGEVISHFTYADGHKRTKIVEKWKRLYGARFQQCEVVDEKEKNSPLEEKIKSESPFKSGKIYQRPRTINKSMLGFWNSTNS